MFIFERTRVVDELKYADPESCVVTQEGKMENVIPILGEKMWVRKEVEEQNVSEGLIHESCESQSGNRSSEKFWLLSGGAPVRLKGELLKSQLEWDVIYTPFKRFTSLKFFVFIFR